MSIFKAFKAATRNVLAITVLDNAADILINRHTQINAFNFHPALRKHANELIKLKYLRGFMEDMNEEEAALLKLSVFFKAAEESDEQQMMALLGDAISEIRRRGEGKIRGEVSVDVMIDTGH